jgi:hypothetical protein
MKLSFRLGALTIIFASAYAGSALLAACGGGGNNNDAGADSSTDTGAKKDSGGGKDVVTPPDDGGGDSGPTPTIDPLCTAGATPSGGSCFADAGLACNPITNGGCKGDAGEACDFTQGGFQCYPPPPPNTTGLCQSCDDQNTACLPGSTCLPATNDPQGGSQCAKFCCNDNDCTGGKCDTTTFQSGSFGFCVK